MCVVSMVGGHYDDKFRRAWPTFVENTENTITRAEFDALKREVAEMKELLKKAVDYDRKTGQPDCQNEEKIKFLREVAKLVGVNLDEVFA